MFVEGAISSRDGQPGSLRLEMISPELLASIAEHNPGLRAEMDTWRDKLVDRWLEGDPAPPNVFAKARCELRLKKLREERQDRESTHTKIRVKSVAALKERVSNLIDSAPIFVGASIDENRHATFSSMGIEPDAIPKLLRKLADHLEQAGRAAFEDQIPKDRKGYCPACQSPVMLVTPIPEEALQRSENKRAMCVCTCGAFLVPSRAPSGEIGLRLVTLEEIAELPDSIRNDMLRTRRAVSKGGADE